MISLYDKIDNRTLKEYIEDDPVEVKKNVEQGNYTIDDTAKIYLNKKYYNVINVDYYIDYNLKTKSYTIDSSVGDWQGNFNESDKSTSNYELKVICYLIKEVIKTKYDISSISINVKSKRVYNIVTKKQRFFDIYSLEFKLWYKIARLIKDNKLKMKYGFLGR